MKRHETELSDHERRLLGRAFELGLDSPHESERGSTPAIARPRHTWSIAAAAAVAVGVITVGTIILTGVNKQGASTPAETASSSASLAQTSAHTSTFPSPLTPLPTSAWTSGQVGAGALFIGTLRMREDSCFVLVPAGDSVELGTLIVWPKGYSVASINGQATIVKPGAVGLAKDGSQLSLGGGFDQLNVGFCSKGAPSRVFIVQAEPVLGSIAAATN